MGYDPELDNYPDETDDDYDRYEDVEVDEDGEPIEDDSDHPSLTAAERNR